MELKLNKTIMVNGEPLEKLTFDFDKLTGNDSQSIEQEMMLQNMALISPSMSGEYLARMACRASTPPIGMDDLCRLSLADFVRVRTAARGFLKMAELSTIAAKSSDETA